MAGTLVKEQLESIGIDLSSRDSTVLKAILMIMKKKDAPTFGDIREHLDKSLKKELSKQWIYKCLSNLEQKGFVKVDMIATPKIYRTSDELIKQVIEREISIAKEKLGSEKEEIAENIKILEDQDMSVVTSFLVGMMRESDKKSKVKFLETLTGVREAILDLLSNTVEGDILRISQKVNMPALETMESSHVDNSILLAAQQEGLQVRALIEIPESQVGDSGKIISTYLRKQLLMLKDVLQSRKLQIRTVRGKSFPHRMLSVNKEKMLLTMSDKGYRPNHAVYLSRDDNPWMVDNVVEKFDEYWEESMDLLDMFKDHLQ